jgi:hypothetical protein
MAGGYPNVTLSTSSTNENSQYLRSNFIPYVQIETNNKQVLVPDVLSKTYLSVINSLSPTAYYTFSTGQQLTTQAFKATGNTSTWWMIAMMNGYIHPLQMNNGDIVLIPNAATAINQSNIQTNAPTPSTVSF